MAKAIFQRVGLFTKPASVIQEAGVEYWRELIFNYMLSAALVLGILALIPSVWLSFANGLSGLGIFDLVAYGAIAALLYARQIRYQIRAAAFLLIGLSIGLIVFALTGDEGPGLFWIFAVPPMASLLLGLRPATFFFLSNVLGVISVTYAIAIQSPFFPRILEFSTGSWIVYGVNFLITNALVTFPLGALLDGLFFTTEQESTSRGFAESVIQTANVIFLQLDAAGNIQKLNSAFEEITGYEAKALQGKSWFETLVPRERYPHVWEEFVRITTKGETTKSFENPILTKDGQEREILWKNTALQEGGKTVGTISFGIDITERKQSTEKISRQLGILQALSAIDRTILSSFDLKLNLSIILEGVVQHLHVDAANIMLFDPLMQTLNTLQGHGFRTRAFESGQVRLGEGYAGRAALERVLVCDEHIDQQTNHPDLAQALREEGFTTYYGVPLIAKGEMRGVLEVFNRGPLDADPDWLALFDSLAGRAAIAIDTVQAFEDLQQSNAELVVSYNEAIEGWSKALDLRDEETEGHSQRVTNLAVRLARQMGLDGSDLVNLQRGALLHDIGKMGVPDSILRKPGELTEKEWKVMKLHPIYAHEMLVPITYLRDALDIPYAHHEKWDGSGYPLGLMAEAIPLAARIFAVIDVYDALISDRPYRKAWTQKEALDYIKEQSGKHFDPAVVQAFLTMQL